MVKCIKCLAFLNGSRESCYSYVYLDCKRKNVVEIVKGYI